MPGKPTLKTGTLSCPQGQEPIQVSRAVTTTSVSPFDGQPDGESPVQRTLHQAMANRLVGTQNVYHLLREYAFRTVWHFRPEFAADKAPLTLAIAHQSHGPKFAVVIKSPQWSATYSELLLDHGWYVLVFDSTTIVQSPKDVVDSILATIHFYAGLPIGTAELNEERVRAVDAADAPAAPLSVAPKPEKRPGPRVKSAKARTSPVGLGILTVVMAALAGMAGYMYLSDPGASPETEAGSDSASLHAKVNQVKVTKEGHAAVTLGDGRKAFVPAKTVKHNPNLLHELIVAWRQGKSLNVLTTAKQHFTYGREIGSVKAEPSAKASDQANAPHHSGG